MQLLLESAGASLERIVRVHVVLADIWDIPEMERVYREFFPIDRPARTASTSVWQRLRDRVCGLGHLIAATFSQRHSRVMYSDEFGGA